MTGAELQYQRETEEYPICPTCKHDVEWKECDQCEEGYSYHDCGEDTCCCLNPENNVSCDTCDGNGGWYYCHTCKKCIPEELAE